jgi:hypothetical protein
MNNSLHKLDFEIKDFEIKDIHTKLDMLNLNHKFLESQIKYLENSYDILEKNINQLRICLISLVLIFFVFLCFKV